LAATTKSKKKKPTKKKDKQKKEQHDLHSTPNQLRDQANKKPWEPNQGSGWHGGNKKKTCGVRAGQKGVATSGEDLCRGKKWGGGLHRKRFGQASDIHEEKESHLDGRGRTCSEKKDHQRGGTPEPRIEPFRCVSHATCLERKKKVRKKRKKPNPRSKKRTGGKRGPKKGTLVED